jgi:protein-S-isoprenylcysteine O-methyltransferase Ste14
MGRGRLAVLVLLRVVLLVPLIGGLLLVPAGSWGYWEAWVYCGIFFVPTLVISLYFLARDPAFLERRMKWREKERRQQVGQSIMSLLYIISILIPGFDYRYGWSKMPVALVLAADAVILGGFLLVLRVFQENRYAASTVEVEAGQQVISSGPYAVVRHPMYLGALLMFLFTPLALGSYWALLAALPLTGGLVLRIRNEEAVLRRELPGYAEYCRKVRWRLIPRAW